MRRVLPGTFAAVACAIAPLHAQDQQGRTQSTAAQPTLYAFGLEPGERVPNVAFTDADGRRGTLAEVRGRAGTVLVVRDAECPVSQRYAPRLAELEREYGPKGFAFAYVDVTPHTREAAKADAAKYGLTGRTILDDTKAVVGALRVRATTEVFVLDARRTLRYRGAVDDQYGIGFHKDAPRHVYLRDALDRLVAGKDVAVRETEASGCLLSIDRAAKGRAIPVTYHNRISRIVQSNCQSCHRAGGLAPMPLETYRQVYERRATIELMVKSGRMPPWAAHKDVGRWANDVSLKERDKADLLAWIARGAPAGDAKDAPLPRAWVPGWNVGKPDAVVQIADTFRIPAQGVVEYKYSYVKTDFPEDKWIAAMEIRPTAPKAVHHVLVFIEEPGRERDPSKRKPGQPAPQGGAASYFAATAPGGQGIVFPPGTAKKLPKGAWLKFQIHYTPNGVEQVDQTRIGFVFADKPVEREVVTRSAFNTKFEIPPGASSHEVQAEYTIRQGGTLLSLFPHMHLRGKAFKYELVTPDSQVTPLLDVPRYDFGWQSYYELETPLVVPPGSKIRATAWYDNSSANPWNPDPTKSVKWGEQTFEEMMIGYFDFLPNPAPPPAPAPDTTRKPPADPAPAAARPPNG